MKAIERINQASNAMPIEKIEVPEWSDKNEPFFIYYTPPTLRERDKITTAAQGEPMSVFAYIFIFKALDAQGENIFTLEDKQALMLSKQGDVIARVAKKIFKVDTVAQALADMEGLGKQSTPST